METELVRERFRPERITTLFVGESAPASGDFFYYGNSGMTRYMQRAMGHIGDNFLESFKARNLQEGNASMGKRSACIDLVNFFLPPRG